MTDHLTSPVPSELNKTALWIPEHVARADCWCEPTVEYRDPETGVAVYLHKEIQ